MAKPGPIAAADLNASNDEWVGLWLWLRHPQPLTGPAANELDDGGSQPLANRNGRRVAPTVKNRTPPMGNAR